MSTHGARTRHLFNASITVERSFEDYGGIRGVEEQINEPKLEIRVGRLSISVRRWSLPKNANNRWNWLTLDPNLHLIRTPMALVELYLEDRFDDKYSYSGDWGTYHDELIR